MNTLSPPTESRRQPNSPAAPVNLPDEVITEIISYFPVKSLMRFRCVSKPWNSLISDPNFIELHYKRSNRNKYLTLFSRTSQNDEDYSVVKFPVRRLFDNPINISDDPFYQLKNNDCRWVIGSCNGLLCLLGYYVYPNCRHIWFRFWNPATHEKSLKLGFFEDRAMELYTGYKFAFGCDKLTGTYKVVALHSDDQNLRTEVRIFSLRDKAWRSIESFPAVSLNHVFPFYYTHPGGNDSVHLNGSIIWLALHKSYWKNIAVEELVIVSLDLGTETFTQFALPRGFNEMAPVEPSICVLMDCLCFSHDLRRTDFVIWQMKEFGVEQSWTQLFKISYDNLRSRHSGFVDLEYSQWLPLHLSGDTLILANNQEGQAIIYNLRDNRVERTRFTNEINWFSAKEYVESLVSTS